MRNRTVEYVARKLGISYDVYDDGQHVLRGPIRRLKLAQNEIVNRRVLSFNDSQTVEIFHGQSAVPILTFRESRVRR